MKHRILPAAALALCGAMLLPALPASAAYESADEITFRAEPLSLIGTEHPQVQYLTKDQLGSLHCAVYIDADRAEFALIGVKLQSDSDYFTFNADTLQQPTLEAYSEPVTQYVTTANGLQEISTKFQPYCLGSLSSQGTYRPNCFSCTMNVDAEENSFTTLWMYGIGQATQFLGDGPSNALPFLTFDLEAAADTPKGTYHVDFVTAQDAATAETERLTCVVSDNGTDVAPEFHNMIPTLKGLTCIVEGERGDATDDDILDAGDAAEVLIYAADAGAGESPQLSADPAQEMRLVRQSDVNRDDSLDANDASLILQYVAQAGAGSSPRWEDLMG